MSYLREIVKRLAEGIAKVLGSRKAWVWAVATVLLYLGKITPTDWIVVSGVFIGAVAAEKLILR